MSSDVHPSDDAVIIGASGGMGRTLQRNLLDQGISVIGMDRAGQPGVMAEDVFSLSAAAIERISTAGLVIIALPDQQAIPAAAIVLPLLRADAVLMDCTSVKTSYCKAVSGISPCAKVSINPLFGPEVEWSNGAMAVTPITDGPAVEHWLEVFRRTGLTLLTFDPETHDRLSAEAQGAVHALIIAYFLSVDCSDTGFAPPPSQLLSLLSARMLSAPPHVYWSIQVSNPFSKAVRSRLRDTLQRLEQIFATEDETSFRAIWETQRKTLGPQLSERETQCRRIIECLLNWSR